MNAYMESIKEALMQKQFIDYNIDLTLNLLQSSSMLNSNINVAGKIDRQAKKAVLRYILTQNGENSVIEVVYADNKRRARDYYNQGEWNEEKYSQKDFDDLFQNLSELVPVDADAFEALQQWDGSQNNGITMRGEEDGLQYTSKGNITRLGEGLFKLDLITSASNDEKHIQSNQVAEVVISLPKTLNIQLPN